MKLHRLISYSLMTAGAIASTGALLKRWQWEESNVLAAIMLDWDDVQAVATRAHGGGSSVADLLCRFKENGATHLSIPELTVKRLLDRGELSVTQGARADRVYLRAQNGAIAELVTTELQARLPHLQAKATTAKNPLISFSGDLPTVAEVGLGFNPAHAELAHAVGLVPVVRPIGYSWVQPEMIERTLDQAAALGARIVVVRGNLIPGHEFRIEATVEAMRRNKLVYAYFSESRHQKGDWFLAKALAKDGLTMLAHEFEPPEMLDDDWFTISYRWANLAVESGIRLCSVRFFRILHAADPLESLAYIEELTAALTQVGVLPVQRAGIVDLTLYQPERDATVLACAGLSTAGAAGLASDLLPIPDRLKLLGLGAAALVFSGLPFLETFIARPDHDHHHHEHDHHHDHDHHHHHHHHEADNEIRTAYAPKGLALATTMVYPAAAVAVDGVAPVTALGHLLAVTTAGAAALSTTTAEMDFLIGVEEYRGFNLDWLIPLGLVASTPLFREPKRRWPFRRDRRSKWRWLPLAGLALTALMNFRGGMGSDLLASYDQEHRHAHTHHLSAFQRLLGDSKMAFSPKPLRKWSLLAPVGLVGAVLFRRNGQDNLAATALTAAAAGQAATLAGFRRGQRPLLKTVEGRAKGWAIGTILAGIIGFGYWLFRGKIR